MVPVITLIEEDRKTAAELLVQQLAGTDRISLLAEDFGGDDFKFEDLRPQLSSEAADFRDVLQRVFEVTLHRDAVYAHLNRGQLLALGANTELRIHYEAARIADIGGIK